MLAEAATPLTYDLNTPAGRAALGLAEEAQDALADVRFVPFRVRPGDETSCLNLYRPTEPRIVGAPRALIARGGFTFSQTVAAAEAERRNPWTLLQRRFTDGAVPAIADESAALWQLHLAIGDDLLVHDERGRPVHLRLVGFLKGSVLQAEIIVAEDRFTALFPAIDGHAFYLIETPRERVAIVEQTLERELAPFGVAVTPVRQRLEELFAVQNTYLSTFQTLGGIGLLLGTLGLGAVVLRNVWERRSELALMRAVGFSTTALGSMVLIENAILVAMGLATGLLSAALVVAPHVISRAAPLPWLSLLLTFVVILAVAMLAGGLALIPVLRSRLILALRSE